MPELSSLDQEEIVRRISRDLADGYDEELEMEIEDHHPLTAGGRPEGDEGSKEYRRIYFRELFRLQAELIRLQDWVVAARERMVILFEGRDAAGKGGVIKRISQRLNPRVCRIVALPAPNDRERTQWYFQRYVSHLPAGGEIVLFDRSWYNRAGVEHVMGFCTPAEYEEFFRSVPEFERMLVRSGIRLLKYWFSITDEEQHLRFLGRIHDPMKQWKLSPMDLESRRRWEDATPGQRKSCCSVRTFQKRAGGSCRRSTRSALASIASIICCSSLRTPRYTSNQSCCQSASTTRTTCDSKCLRRCWFQRCTEVADRSDRRAKRDRGVSSTSGLSKLRGPV
jgi:polyphosphate kinase